MIQRLSSESIQDIQTACTIQNLQSFVKEIVENSIDAKSTQIVVIFYRNGLDGFEVSDDGVGIKYSEADKLLSGQCTSKLEQFDQLQNVETHGFRGEALNAIATLAKISIITKHQDDDIGWKKENNTTSLFPRERGTTIKIKNLFHSLPVRKLDFEKNYKLQYNRAINGLTEYAIIQNDIDIKVWNQDQQRNLVLSSGQKASFKNKIKNVLGDQVFLQLSEINVVVNENTKIEGFISKTIESGSSRGQVKKTMWYCYVNQRPINAPKSILKLFTDIYRQYNPNGKFIFILNIIVNKIGDVDFNASIDKREVYLRQDTEIHQALETYIKQKLEICQENIKQVELKQVKLEMQPILKEVKQEDMRQSITSEDKKGLLRDKQIQQQSDKRSVDVKVKMPVKQLPQLNSVLFQSLQNKFGQNTINSKQKTSPKNEGNFQETVIKKQDDLQDPNRKSLYNLEKNFQIQQKLEENQYQFQKNQFSQLQILGQFNNGFIISKLDDKLFLLDQHACDEKTNYERLLSYYNLERVNLVQPICFQLQPYHLGILRDNIEFYDKKFLFRCQIKDNQVFIYTIPQYGKYTFDQKTLMEIIENQITDNLPGLKNIIANQACRSSIMVGDQLSKGEMKKVVCKLETLDSPWNCPHGRPTFIKINQPQINLYKPGFSSQFQKK
ncbi:hypothetical protein pb186bvf_001285 [Paramecium bursaria]